MSPAFFVFTGKLDRVLVCEPSAHRRSKSDSSQRYKITLRKYSSSHRLYIQHGFVNVSRF